MWSGLTASTEWHSAAACNGRKESPVSHHIEVVKDSVGQVPSLASSVAQWHVLWRLKSARKRDHPIGCCASGMSRTDSDALKLMLATEADPPSVKTVFRELMSPSMAYPCPSKDLLDWSLSPYSDDWLCAITPAVPMALPVK